MRSITDIRTERIGLPRMRTRLSPLKITAAASAMAALLMVFAIQRLPSAERIEVPPPVIPEVTSSSVGKTHREPVRVIETVHVASTEPVPVKTETIRPEPTPSVVPPVIMPPEEETPPPKRRLRVASRGGDVCTRHGKRKVITRGGKSWRCR